MSGVASFERDTGHSHAFIDGIFASLQGEGPRVGRETLFVRFRGCNWGCAYCDTKMERGGAALLQCPENRDRYEKFPNPMALETVVERIRLLRRAHAKAGADQDVRVLDLALTGGEPLLHASFLGELLRDVVSLDLHRYLETNGTLPDALDSVLHHLDEICMDIKLASTTGIETPWELHERFLQKASLLPLVIKLVVGAATSQEELLHAASLLSDTKTRGWEVILQPVWGENGPGVRGGRLLDMVDFLAKQGISARVIPQVHKILGIP